MFFIISKILGYSVRPIIWIVILLAIAIFNKNKSTRRKSLIASFVILIVFSNSFIVTKVTGMWAVSPQKIDRDYDVGIVLGGRTVTFDQKYDRRTYHENVDRLLQAVELYEEGKIKKILITGGSANLIYKNVKEADLMDAFLKNIKIPSSDILIDTLAENTHQNALYSKRILEKYPNLKKYLLITSSIHMRRALGCFEKEGLKVTPYPTNLINSDGPYNFEYLFIPQSSNFLTWDGTIHEIIGFLVYKIMGYI
ncbi:MAG: YdcF family protein [Bacteroidales bacterium]|nr:YdcF family protein [Bacteroidales bacterium]